MKNLVPFLTIIFFNALIAQNSNDQFFEINSGTFKTDDAEIFYLEKGSADTTLLFLHGWAINSSYWTDQLNFFGENYRIFAMDLPGFGKSKAERENYSVEKYAEDVNNFIKQLDLKNVILIGHSMSGDVILEAAVKNDDSVIGIVGIDNFKFVGMEMSPEQKKEMNIFMHELEKNYEILAPQYAENYLFSASTDSSVKNRVKDDYKNSNPEVAVSSIKNVFNYNEPDKLQKLNLKLYLINSDGMPTNNAGLDKFAAKSYEVLEINNVGHFPMIEKPEEFNKLLQKVIYKINKD